MYPDLPKASWYGVTESFKISSEEEDDREWKLLDYRWWVVRFDVYVM